MPLLPLEDPWTLSWTPGAGQVQGADDRVRVPTPTRSPWRHVCALRLNGPDGRVRMGTGWLIGPRVVVTAAHCLAMPGLGTVRSVDVYPALHGDPPPPHGTGRASVYGAVRSTEVEIHPSWADGLHAQFDPDGERFDFGAIFLPGRGLPDAGWFGFCAAPDDVLLSEPLSVVGYPRAPDNGTIQYERGQRAESVDSAYLTYQIDTSGGQSGAPIWMRWRGQTLAVGIHTWGGPEFNRGVRITPPVFQQLRAWKRRGLEPR